MFCPQCGTEMPDDAQFCPACGADAKAGAAGLAASAQPTTPLPVVPAAAPAPVYAPAPTAAMPAVAPQFAPPPAAIPGAPPKKKTGLVIAIVVIVLLLLCCAGPAVAMLFVPAVRDRMPWNTVTSVEPKPPVATSTPTPSGNTADDKDIDAARKVIEAFYAAFNAGDLEAIKATLAPDVASEITADWFAVGTQSTFEFTRGIADAGTVTIFGRESVEAFGSGGDGGAKYTLVSVGGQWRITAWSGADRMQIEGADATGSSSGVTGALTDAGARNVVTKLLDARMKGNANLVRQLTTASFQTSYGDIWLDGRDNSEFFFKFRITKVVVSTDMATVETSEDWNSGTEGAIYGVVRQNGALLVDTWN